MAEEKKSRLYTLKPLIERWPAVAKPEGHVNFRTKILWTIFCLILYFILTNVMIFGLIILHMQQKQLDVKGFNVTFLIQIM